MSRTCKEPFAQTYFGYRSGFEGFYVYRGNPLYAEATRDVRAARGRGTELATCLSSESPGGASLRNDPMAGRGFERPGYAEMVHIPVVTRPGPSTQSHFYAGEFELPFDVDWGVVRLGAGRYTVKVICPDPPYSVIVTGRDFIVMIPASVGIPRAGRDGSQLTLEKIQAKHVVSSVELAQFGLTLLFPVSMDCKGESDNPHRGSP